VPEQALDNHSEACCCSTWSLPNLPAGKLFDADSLREICAARFARGAFAADPL
jgi:hypothetical protein